MDPDPIQQAWQAQPSGPLRPTDADVILEDIRRQAQRFDTMIFWRDVREIGTALALIPVWLILGVQFSLPWSWYLIVPALAWAAGYMFWDRRRHRRPASAASQPLREHVENALARVDQQIRLLGSVLWWYLLPLGLAVLAFLGEVTWRSRSDGWLTAVVAAAAVTCLVLALAFVYRLNQQAVRASLEPRRQELLALRASLQEE